MQRFLTTEPFQTTPKSPQIAAILQLPLTGVQSKEPLGDLGSTPGQGPDSFRVVFDNGLVYKGAVKAVPGESRLVPTGAGVFEAPNGDRFEGEIKDRGQGKFVHEDGTVYEGMLFKMHKAGVGVERYSNGSVYRGMFKKNLKWGKGRMEFGNGDVFEGNFKDGKRNGIGKYVIAKGGEFVGDWKDDFLEGNGKWIVGNGSEISGAFVKSRVKL